MSAGSLARRYAKALMGIGEEEGSYEALGRELGSLAAAIAQSSELRETLSSPVFPRSDRRRVLEALLVKLGASKVIVNFTLLLLDRERVSVVPSIARELDAMIAERVGRISADVRSATALSPAQEKAVRDQLEQLSGKTVEMTTAVDSELLGGAVATVGDVVYDGSLRTQLSRIRESLGG